MRRRLPVRGATATALVSAALMVVAGAAAGAPAVDPPPSPAVAVRWTPTAPALPVPTRPPADPYEAVPLVPVADLTIPRIGVERTVHEGVWLTVIDVGPGHWPGTAEPGGWGNVVIASHRTVHGGPFLRIGELVAGDEIRLHDADGTYRYAVTGSEVVTPKAMWVVDQQPGRTLTLIACHPIGSATERLVVHAALVATTPAVRPR